MLRLHHMPASGNCYKVRLLLAQLDMACEFIEVDVAGGATREAGFRALNPAGKVPLLQLADGRVLPESNAILCFLADATHLWQGDTFERAQVLQWLFFEQYSHEPFIATNRAWLTLFDRGEEMRERIEANKPSGYAALDVMESRLADAPFLVDAYSIADIALYAYTHVAEDGEYDLGDYPAIRAWLQRVAEQPGHVPLLGPT